MPTPLPHQVVGADFLSARRTALLADEPRVGKTGAAIMAADDVWARKILVITTASGRPVWRRAFAEWSWRDRSVEVFYSRPPRPAFKEANVQIVGWAGLSNVTNQGPWDLVIVDESHYAKNPGAQRTRALFGLAEGTNARIGLVSRAQRVWCLTGTPIPNAPNDLFAMLRALAPERLEATSEWPDVMKYDAFLHRYCVVRKKHINRYSTIDVVIAGRNLDELKARLDGFMLRRTQKDVGITRPVYDLLPIHITPTQRKKIEAEVEGAEDILVAAETGETASLETHLGTLRRITGEIKAEGVIAALKDEFEGGLDKVVVMAWHKDTMDKLQAGLAEFGVVRVDGSTPSPAREAAELSFRNDPNTRVFIGQIIACGEAIDLSAAAELVFAESSFVPKDMHQAALRVTNHGQARSPRVRVAALEGSVDEALQAILIRKVQAIKGVLG